MQRGHIALHELTDSHIIACVRRAPGTGKARVKVERAALFLLLKHLRHEAGVPDAPVEVSPIDELRRQYVDYLRHTRGLAENSVQVYTPFIQAFVGDHVARTGGLCVQAIDAMMIRRFLLDHAREHSSESGRLLATALRSFCRFLFLQGDLTTDLSLAVPPVRRSHHATVPAFLTAADTDRVLAAVDRSTSTGRRDYAILLLLARLGLRAGEIVTLELDDIRWRSGELVIRGKGPQVAHLPVLAEVGEALTAYLRDDGRASASRRVFQRVWAPQDGLAGPAAVGHIVRRALAPAHVRRPGRGAAYLFRHGLATQLMPPRGLAGRDRASPQASVPDHDRHLRAGLLRGVAHRGRSVAGYERCPMSPLREALTQYVAARRALGTQLREPAVTLGQFVAFLERQGAEFITLDFALRWATAPPGVQRATWARRLTHGRRFAMWLQGAHSRFPGHALTPTGVMAIRCKQFHRPDL